MSMEFTRYEDGRCCLTDEDGDMLWSSDNDDDFQEEFGETIDSEDVDGVLEYLEDAGYLTDGDTVDVVDEDDEETESVEDEPTWRH